MTWYAIRTASQLERHAAAALEAADCVVFLPMMQVTCRPDRNSRRRIIERPMMPGYVMVRDYVPWSTIANTRRYGSRVMLGVLSMAGGGHNSGGAPSPIDDEIISAIAKLDGAPQPAQSYRPGDRVRIRLGRLDTRDVVVSAVDHGRIQVAMLMLGGTRLLTVDEDKVEAA